MAVIYSESTRRFMQELEKLSRLTHHKSDNHLKTPKQLKGVRRLYEADTSKFEPTFENRDHLINTLMPYVVKVAKSIVKKYGSRVEYDDCISAGLQGAIIATDKYIEKSLYEQQPAKLSTYAHAYIVKYINEYCASVNTILSHGTTKWVEASTTYVMSGNQTYQEEGRSVEFFDIANDSNLMSEQSSNDENDLANTISEQLFYSVSKLDKEILFMMYGINGKPMEVKDIAKTLHCTQHYVTKSVAATIETIRETMNHLEPKEIIDAIRNSDVSISPIWQRATS